MAPRDALDGVPGDSLQEAPGLGGRVANVYRTALRIAYILAVAYAVAAYGSVRSSDLAQSTLLLSILAGLAALAPVPTRRAALVGVAAIAVFALLGAVIVLQATPIDDDWPEVLRALEHPVWAEAAEALGRELPGTISVAPTATLASLLAIAGPFLAFGTGLVLFGGDREAGRLWRWLALLGIAVAAVGVLQFLFDPGQLLFQTKTAYITSLTGTFVNRNTAATFFGVSSLLVFAVMVRALVDRGYLPTLPAFWSLLGWSDPAGRRLLRWAGGLVLVLFALILTASRMGVAATVAGWVPLVLYVVQAGREDGPGGRIKAGLGLAVGFAALVLVAGERIIFRSVTRGLDDDRWCLYDAIARGLDEHPLGGTGFGTFYEAFPAYRAADCAPGSAFDRGHSVYLEAAFGLGWPAAAAIIGLGLLVLAVTVARGFAVRQRYRFAPLATLGMVLVAAVHGLVDFSMQINGFAVFFAAALAAGVPQCLPAPRNGPSTVGPRLVDHGAMLLVRAALLAGGVAFAQPALHAASQSLSDVELLRIAGQIESNYPVDPQAVAPYLEPARLAAVARSCRSDSLRAAVTITLKQADLEADRAAALARAEALLSAALACFPTEGNFWLRLAMVQALAGADPENLAPLAVLSQRYAPAEYQVVMARAAFLGQIQPKGEALRAVLDRDLDYVANQATVPDAVFLMGNIPASSGGLLLKKFENTEPERRLLLQRRLYERGR
ncbi:O-antigen ligase family protein [Prosthecomicrobium sp. N25]|uniref:O-antigen ligase family protein n=1 Tax=Prosthecomicrobium sp. N25 TaxID=3129254 RepID=UPI003077C8D0